MPTPRAIQRRIKSVRNISQVTRAMEMVAASKMRRAQNATLASRAYAEKSWEVLTFLASQPGRSKLMHPLLESREQIKNIALIIIAGDRGLCGAYNVNVLRSALDFTVKQDKPTKYLTIGKRATSLIARMRKELLAEFSGLSEKPKILDIGPIAKIAIAEFLKGNVDEVYITYTDFVNVLVQKPTTRQLLPIQTAPIEQHDGASAVYLYEPDPESVLDSVLPRFTELQIYQALLESVASEWAARMVGMRNATANARDLIDSLTLAMNKARQANITREMLDIVGGAEALRATLKAKAK
ncbi:MAG: ATP synthase F1 subunit gamma [Chloroflexi bacterium]|nr:ATP synthase F1 subunit gamma [Chloroflexota bacterium]